MKSLVQVVQDLIQPYIDKHDKAVAKNIAPVETDATSASQGYAVGKQLILNDILYDVTAAITAGDPLTVGTNITAADPVVEQISTKENVPTVLTQTLASGTTSVTFTGLPTTGNYLIDFYAENGANYTAIDTSTAGTAILTYEAPVSAVTIYCEIKGV